MRNWAVNAPKVTHEQVEEIRHLYLAGVKRAELCERFRLSGSTIWHITRGYYVTKTPDGQQAIQALEDIRAYIDGLAVVPAEVLTIAEMVEAALTR